jgi:predicted transcriptional regulator
MGKVKESEFQKPAPALGDEDEETLAAIDEGIRDANAGRTVPAEEVRKLLPQWITSGLSTDSGAYRQPPDYYPQG